MSAKKKVGLIVNPVAGMGGSVGLKGTDGQMRHKAVELGATPVTPERARQFLTRIRNSDRIELLVAPGRMGEQYVSGSPEVVGEAGEITTADDTRRIAREMVSRGVEVLVFVGGDGTARDIQDAVGLQVPVIAVPAGVKMFSAVFAVNPGAASRLVDSFLEGAGYDEQEVLDIDEEAFRQNRLASRLYGYLLTPRASWVLQRGKECSPSDAAAAVGVPKTLLGVDAVADGRLVGSDLGEKGILQLMDSYMETRIVVTPIGGNGFLFGRGNRQFTPHVLRRVGRKGIIVVATSDKLLLLDALRVDKGDFNLDQELSGYMEVIVGGNETIKMEVRG